MSVPRSIDHFEIQREVGRGGMGRVYLAMDRRLGRQVAIKVVRIDEAVTEHDAKELARLTEYLLREARICATLDHPGIVTIYQVGLFGDQPYVVMPFIEGPTLEALLTPGTPYDRKETTRILSEAAAALDYAHGLGIIHRDIKPANIMLTRTGAAKICDFGIAKSALLSGTGSTTLSGTLHYMSPEQLAFKPVDKRVDQWALGVVAYRMLTGDLPFRGKEIQTLAWQIMHEEPQAPGFAPALPPRVAAVLNRALSKDPGPRYPTCSEFAADLAEAQRAIPDRREIPRQEPDPRVVERPINLGFDGAIELGFPHGWFDSVGYVMGVSTGYSVRVVRREDSAAGMCLMVSRYDAGAQVEFASVMQRFPAGYLSGRTIRLEGELRTQDVSGWAGFWLRADGMETPDLFFDNMSGHRLEGTIPWGRHTIEAKLPPQTYWLNIGVVFQGSGTVWADNLRLQVWDAGAWKDV